MDINTELEKSENILDDIDRFEFYYVDVEFEIEYDQWNDKQKRQFIDEVSKFIYKKYNIDILDVFPQIQTIGGIYQDIINNLRYSEIADYDSILSIANDINLIYIDIRREIKNERFDLFLEYVDELNRNMKLLKGKTYISPGEFEATVNIEPRKNKDYDIYLSAYDYAIDILNEDYGFNGDDLSEIVDNVNNEQDAIELCKIISNISIQLQRDIEYFENWEEKFNKAFE